MSNAQSKLAGDVLGFGDPFGGNASADLFHPPHGFREADAFSCAVPFQGKVSNETAQPKNWEHNERHWLICLTENQIPLAKDSSCQFGE